MQPEPHVLKSCLTVLGAMLLTVLLASCTSVDKVDANTWARDFYNQPNSTPLAQIQFVPAGGRLLLEGVTALTVSTQLPLKSMMPRETNWVDGMFDAVKTVAPYAAGAYLLKGSIGAGNSSTTTNNAAAPATP